MSYLLFKNNMDTLQLGFLPTAPEFLIQSEDQLPIGDANWAVIEQGEGDGKFTPNETLDFVSVDISLTYDVRDIVSVKYIGAVDLDADGTLDGMIFQQGTSEFILTDKAPFLDFQPFSTRVVGEIVIVGEGGPGTPVENVPTRGDDELWGTSGKDIIRGLGGDDDIYGLGRNDRLFGQAGDDALAGGSGRDILKGGNGHDLIWGGKGNDKLFGGKGIDAFSFSKGEGSNTVEDFDLLRDFFLIGRGASSMADIQFESRAGGASFSFSDVEVFVVGVSVTELQNTNLFDF